MNFGNVFTMLCSLTFLLSCSVANSTEEVEKQIISNESKEAYTKFLDKVDTCFDKKARNENPYPINAWLIELPRKKQIAVLSYLHELAQYDCSATEQTNLVSSLEKHNEEAALNLMKNKGWLDIPTLRKELKFTEDDRKHLQVLIDRNYLPFNGVELDSIIRKLRPEASY